jgi:hypothetical protein
MPPILADRQAFSTYFEKHFKFNSNIILNLTFLKKLIRIPVEHFREDPVIRVNAVNDLCEKDSNRQIFTFAIVEPNTLFPYTCSISKNNHANIDLVVKMYNDTFYTADLPSLPPNRDSFFNLSKNRDLVVEILCSNNFVSHKRTVDLKICAKLVKISDIALQNNTISGEKQLTIKFSAKVRTNIAKLKAVDLLEKQNDSYAFSLAAPNDYIDVRKIMSLY